MKYTHGERERHWTKDEEKKCADGRRERTTGEGRQRKRMRNMFGGRRGCFASLLRQILASGV